MNIAAAAPSRQSLRAGGQRAKVIAMRTLLLSALLLTSPVAAAPFSFSAARIGDDVKALASDAFAGLGPGEVGEAQTLAFLAARFQAAGLEPAGPQGSWLQPVPLIRLDRAPGAALSVRVNGTALPIRLGENATLALRLPGDMAISAAPMVFAGFGVVAGGHDPYAGVDVAGKVVLLLAGDPDGEAGADLGFEGRRLTYAGRVGIKMAAAAKAGAVGAIVLHEDFAASYPLAQLVGTERVPQMVPGATTFGGAFRFASWIEGGLGQRLATASPTRHAASASCAAASNVKPLPTSSQGW